MALLLLLIINARLIEFDLSSGSFTKCTICDVRFGTFHRDIDLMTIAFQSSMNARSRGGASRITACEA
jgi:hypothetical protein